MEYEIKPPVPVKPTVVLTLTFEEFWEIHTVFEQSDRNDGGHYAIWNKLVEIRDQI